MQRGEKALLHEELKENAYWDIKVFVMKQWTLPIMILSGICEVLENYHIDTNKCTEEPEQMNKTRINWVSKAGRR